MRHVYDRAQYAQNSDRRARKVSKRRDRSLRQRKQSARHNLQKDKRYNKPIACWVVDRFGPLHRFFEGVKNTVRPFLESRKRIDLERKRAALRALDAASSLEITRICKGGSIITWENGKGESFHIHIREGDTRSMLDDWQWRLDRPTHENHIINDAFFMYPDIKRYQLELLFDKGSVEYNSKNLGNIRIFVNSNGVFHNEQVEPEPVLDLSLIELSGTTKNPLANAA